MDKSSCEDNLPLDEPPTNDDEFYQRLEKFPNLFLHDCVNFNSKERMQTLLRILMHQQHSRQEQPPSEDLSMDVYIKDLSCTKNRKVLLLWKLGHRQEAKDQAEHLLREHPTDLIATTNLAFILRQTGDNEGAENLLEKLEGLRVDDPAQFSEQEVEAQEDMRYLYSKLFHEVPPYLLTDHMEAMLQKDPNNSQLKLNLAMTLRRSTSVEYMSKYPEGDYRQALRRAIELWADMKNDQDSPASTRAVAATELGGILGWQGDEVLRAVANEEKERLGLEPAACIEEALKLNSSDATILVRAGKFFRYHNLDRSRELLEKAVSLRVDAIGHHQLGLTLQKLAEKEKKKRGRRDFGRRTPHQGNPGRQPSLQRSDDRKPHGGYLSREDTYVNDAIMHMEKALEFCYGKVNSIMLSLINIHQAVGEYTQVLEYCKQFLDCYTSPGILIKAFEHTRNAYTALCDQASVRSNRRRAFQKMIDILDKMIICVQCQLWLPQRSKWATSFTTLKSFVKELRSAPGRPQARAMHSIDSHGTRNLSRLSTFSNLQLFHDILPYTDHQASDSTFLAAAFQGLLKENRYDDAMLFLELLRMTDQRDVLAASDDAHLLAKIYVLACREKLQTCQVTHDSFEASLAKLLFRNACQTLLDVAAQRDGEQSRTEADTEDNGKFHNSEHHTRMDYHVQLLHDPEEEDAKSDSISFQSVLQDTCGLNVNCMRDHTTAEKTEMKRKAQVTLLLITKKDISPQFGDIIAEAFKNNNSEIPRSSTTSVRSRDGFVIVRLDDAPLPPIPGHHRSFKWNRELLQLAQEVPRSSDGAAAICNLFCEIFGIHL